MYIYPPQWTHKNDFQSFLLLSAVTELSLSALLHGFGTKEESHVFCRVHVDCFQKHWKCLLIYLYPTSKEQWKSQVDTPKKLSSQGTFGKKYLIAQVSYLFLLQFATHFASKDGAAGLKMMDCPKCVATEILQLQWVTRSRR